MARPIAIKYPRSKSKTMTRRQRDTAIKKRALEVLARSCRDDTTFNRQVMALLVDMGKTISDLTILRELDLIEFLARKSRGRDPQPPRPVPKMDKRHLRIALKEKAQEVLAKRGNNPEVRRQVDALLGSLDDTLSNEAILEELIALDIGGITFLKRFGDNSPRS